MLEARNIVTTSFEASSLQRQYTSLTVPVYFIVAHFHALFRGQLHCIQIEQNLIR